ncbi:MAG: RNA methyltransferase [Parafannyhessea umbonata]|uniref:TrmH family RNA methyltransferase n=1 Tax=Parafannyhessea umbonata TaxID=604330 RepID=UPI0026E96086|nr:RNA methyltransferase [Parafannyhessea umbonata]MCI6681830.1 RNA methyltransferase [Parafannyhessea umbonata]MDY4015569.1 RNA methyltransferase [Parafannyhessea umbonata]
MAISRITSLSDSRLDPYLRLSERQLRSVLHPDEALVILESLFVIKLAFERGLDVTSVLVDERHVDALERAVPGLGEKDVDVLVADRDLLSQVTGFNVTRGYMAAARRPAARGLRDVLEGARSIAVLEGLVDVSNLGAIFRNAAALGVDGVVLAPECADPLNRRAVRVSMGNVFLVPWAVAPRPWPGALLDELRQRGFETVAMALDERAVRLGDPSLGHDAKTALFFGTEGTGLTRPVLDGVDRTVIIPMARGVDSLNVAASSAVAFWELFARRRG